MIKNLKKKAYQNNEITSRILEVVDDNTSIAIESAVYGDEGSFQEMLEDEMFSDLDEDGIADDLSTIDPNLDPDLGEDEDDIDFDDALESITFMDDNDDEGLLDDVEDLDALDDESDFDFEMDEDEDEDEDF